ncbi:hypothetical protein EDC96DRAFT_550374 [Choanephora cucurbitarum]|nr:hypothetical protein EDC96DRAFT_550374 [Choanephora cucurbitarum]
MFHTTTPMLTTHLQTEGYLPLTLAEVLLVVQFLSTQMEVAIKKLEVAQQKSDMLIEQLIRENQELKAKFRSMHEDSDRFGFPGSDAELQGLKKTVVECEMERLGETG